MEGFEAEYDSLGYLTGYEYYYHDIKVGDHLFYKSHQLYEYMFIDFNRVPICVLQYDSSNKCKLEEFKFTPRFVNVNDRGKKR